MRAEVDVLIDRITDCLIDTRTGEEVETEYRLRSAPHNYSRSGLYEGVGAHLFAIACKVSEDAGCDGVVAFTAKSDLVPYYARTLSAVEIFPIRMVIFEDAAKVLLDKYIRR